MKLSKHRHRISAMHTIPYIPYHTIQYQPIESFDYKDWFWWSKSKFMKKHWNAFEILQSNINQIWQMFTTIKYHNQIWQWIFLPTSWAGIKQINRESNEYYELFKLKEINLPNQTKQWFNQIKQWFNQLDILLMISDFEMCFFQMK